MPKKRHTSEEIVTKLRQVDLMTSHGRTPAEAIRAIGVAEPTYHRWGSEFGGLKLDQVRRLKESAIEISRLRRAVSDLTLDKLVLTEVLGEVVSPSWRRRAVETVRSKYGVSKRRACQILGQPRSTQRRVPAKSDEEERLTAAIMELASLKSRHDYRRVTALLRAAGLVVNNKQGECIWRPEGLKLPGEQPKTGRPVLENKTLKQVQPNQLDVLDRALALASENSDLHRTERAILVFMARVAWSKVPNNDLVRLVGVRHREIFARIVLPGLQSRSELYRRRALALTFCFVGIHPCLVAEFMGNTPFHIRRLLLRVRRGRYDGLLARRERPYKYENTDIREHLFRVLHVPPADYDINRTTWTIDLLHDVLKDEGTLIGKNAICRIIKDEGYAFKKTREVPTSNDPDYREKLQKITRTLRRLGPMDRFFSIDEYGPVSVRERGGRRRARRGEKPVVPQYQVSKGNVIVTAALELGSNQITHFYSQKKDTEEMIKLLHVLLDQYWDCRRLYLSWHAASWHSSRAFQAEVKRVNQRDYRNTHQSPMVKLRPLPARAQFLNVIESVFSGLSQSVVHNSNYQSVDAMKAAVDRYIDERNEHFRLTPRKAGNKIWGSEQAPSYFSVAHNCKNPRFVRVSGIR